MIQISIKMKLEEGQADMFDQEIHRLYSRGRNSNSTTVFYTKYCTIVSPRQKVRRMSTINDGTKKRTRGINGWIPIAKYHHGYRQRW